MKVHLLVEVTRAEDHEDQPLKDVRGELVDSIERHTLWVGSALAGEAVGASAYDVTVLSFDVMQPDPPRRPALPQVPPSGHRDLSPVPSVDEQIREARGV